MKCSTQKNRKTIVIGMGCVTAAGVTLEQNLAHLFSKDQNICMPSRFSTDHNPPYPVFEVRPPEANSFYAPEQQRVISGLSLTCRFMIEAAAMAMVQAGLLPDWLEGKRVGVCVGTSVGCTPNSVPFYRDFRLGKKPDTSDFMRYLRSNPAASLSDLLNLNGPVQTVNNACASGTDAIGIAAGWLQQGLCDMALAGGADELSQVAYNGFASLQILDHAPARPFDNNRGGLNLGEGAGMLLMTSENISQKFPCVGKVTGYGICNDRYHLVAPHPQGRGLQAALDQALYFARLRPGDISFVNAHGTGTRDNDLVESRVLAEKLPGIPFFSTKGSTGHTLGAAGAIEAIYTLACLNRGEIAPSKGFEQPDPDLPCSPVQSCMSVSGDMAISESLAFGGHNSVLVLEKGDKT